MRWAHRRWRGLRTQPLTIWIIVSFSSPWISEHVQVGRLKLQSRYKVDVSRFECLNYKYIYSNFTISPRLASGKFSMHRSEGPTTQSSLLSPFATPHRPHVFQSYHWWLQHWAQDAIKWHLDAALDENVLEGKNVREGLITLLHFKTNALQNSKLVTQLKNILTTLRDVVLMVTSVCGMYGVPNTGLPFTVTFLLWKSFISWRKDICLSMSVFSAPYSLPVENLQTRS